MDTGPAIDVQRLAEFIKNLQEVDSHDLGLDDKEAIRKNIDMVLGRRGREGFGLGNVDLQEQIHEQAAETVLKYTYGSEVASRVLDDKKARAKLGLAPKARTRA